MLASARPYDEIDVQSDVIICGFGRMGWTICEQLSERGRQFVVIDTNDKILQSNCSERQWLYVVGDASDDRVLAQAGISRAKALAAVLPTDADNVFVTLTARLMSGKIDTIFFAVERILSMIETSPEPVPAEVVSAGLRDEIIGRAEQLEKV